jgi:hypothetical protein
MTGFLIILAFSPVLVLIIHSMISQIITRVRPEISRQLICIASSLIGNIPMAILLWHVVLKGLSERPSELTSTAIYAFIVYNTLGYCYFHLFNMSETARRVRVLSELNSAGKLTTEEIMSIYDIGDMFDVRIKRLLSMKQVEEVEGRYVLKKRFLFFTAKCVSLWAHILGFHFLDRFDHQ